MNPRRTADFSGAEPLSKQGWGEYRTWPPGRHGAGPTQFFFYPAKFYLPAGRPEHALVEDT